MHSSKYILALPIEEERRVIDEKERIELLEYYIGGKLRNPEHNKSSIGLLMDLGYLRCGITSQIEETIKTTSMGLVYLRMRGHDHGAPQVVNGRMLRKAEPRKGAP